MKKFRPYKTFPDDIVGKAVIVNTGQVTLVYHLDTAKKLMQTTVKGYSCISAFEELTFTDGTPCGEEYEEVVELEHDKVYLVNNTKVEQWLPRHFCKHATGLYLFYDAGLSSKTQVYKNSITSWQQVCEYDKELAFTYNEPKEYLIKQS
jgi:hypothetical protein